MTLYYLIVNFRIIVSELAFLYMKVCITTGIFLLGIGWGLAQSNARLNAYLLTSGGSQGLKAEERVDNLVDKLRTKQGKSDRKFLGSIFNVIHRQLLKEYKQYSGFGEIFSNGRYDCLTATALYSLILERSGFEYSIIETNYHIFLMIKADDGEVLIESTDPIDGFVDDQMKIEERLIAYRQAESPSGKEYYPAQFNLFQAVDTQQLVGLLYFNQSVKAFNNQQWLEAANLIRQTKMYYDSPRVDEMEVLLAYAMEPGTYSLVQREED